jgi:HK97 family phage major capsid protein
MREILAEIEAKTAEAKSFMSGENKDVAKANAIMDKVAELKSEYETEKRIFEAEKDGGIEVADPHPGNGAPEVKELTGEQIVAKEVRAIMRPHEYGADKDLQESVDADGGYTVPEDIATKVNHWPEIVYSFLDDISVENVSTNKGARTYQKKAQTEAFIDLDENGAITKKITAPQFERVSYAIQDRAGFMPVSNDLIHDSDANITAIVTEWLGRANIATANEKILGIIKAKSQVAIAGLNGIKKIVNVTLGQAYKSGAKIITNDDGLNYLDTLEDKNGRPLLNADPTDSARLALRCGTVVVPVKVVPNAAFASEGTKVPFVIGDLKAGIRKYNRQSMSLKASDVAVLGDFNAFAMNMTLIRAILRDDYKSLDADAYVYGYIDTAAGE